jgi:hypothetical protein
MVTDTKWTDIRSAKQTAGYQNGTEFNVTRFDERSWFILTVTDKTTNGVVLQDGFGRQFGQELTRELLLREPGNYMLKFEGSYANVDTVIIVPKKGNIA